MGLLCRLGIGCNGAQWFSKLFSPQKCHHSLGTYEDHVWGLRHPRNNSVGNCSGLFSQGSQVIWSQL